jgi:hypothetical protein
VAAARAVVIGRASQPKPRWSIALSKAVMHSGLRH